MDKRSLVSVVDDDESVRESLPDLLWQFGFASQAFASAEAFLDSEIVSETSCLLLDITMPDITSIVYVVDDDVSVRESLELLIKHAGWQPELFASAQEFLSRPRATV